MPGVVSWVFLRKPAVSAMNCLLRSQAYGCVSQTAVRARSNDKRAARLSQARSCIA